MPAVRQNASRRWSERAQVATADYSAGVAQPRRDWAQATQAAAAAQAAGVQAAIQAKRFEKGVAKAGSAKWAAKAGSKGASRFSAGVQEAVGDYEAATAPYTQVIQATQLPPRGAKGDVKNYDRVRVMGEALRKAKLARA